MEELNEKILNSRTINELLEQFQYIKTFYVLSNKLWSERFLVGTK
jgi:hypothetical protein